MGPLKWIGDFVGSLGLEGPWATVTLLGLIALVGVFFWHRAAIRKGKGPALDRRLADIHDRNGWRSAYRAKLRSWLDWLDGALGTYPWSTGAYDWALRLALIYPIASLFVFWVITGRNTSGIPGLLLENVSGLGRLATLLAVLTATALWHKAIRTDGRRGLAYLAGAFAVAVAVAFAFAVAGAVAVAVAFAVAVAVAVAGAGAGAFAFAFAFAFAVAVAVAGAVVGAFAGAGAGAFAGATILTIIIIAQNRAIRHNRLALFHIFHWLFLASFLAMSLWWIAGQVLTPDRIAAIASLFAFLTLLPLVNAVFDWLSLGATRFFLRRAQHDAWPLANTLLDLAVGLALIVPLALAITAALQGINVIAAAGGARQTWIDVPNILATIRHAPTDMAVWWIYVTVFSTLLPTFAHFVAASGSLVTVEWDWLSKRLLDLLTRPDLENDSDSITEASLWLTVRTVLGVVLGGAFFVGVLWLFYQALPGATNALLCAAEATARTMGAAIPAPPGQCPAWLAGQ